MQVYNRKKQNTIFAIKPTKLSAVSEKGKKASS